MSERSTHDQSLKPREREIVQYMADGLTNREIAERLYIGVETVRTYAKQIYAKLNVSDRVQAGKKARALGLLAESAEGQRAIYKEKHKLPAQLNPFIGRERELSELRQQLARPEVRLLTILAPGGMGKTRLAVEAAVQQVGNYQDGIFFIPLQPLSDADDIVLAIAEALNLHFQQDERGPEQQLLDYLSRKQMLLVMDNWEHLLSGAPLVVEILKAAPRVKVVTTSRQKLNLSAEHVFLLDGLAFPGREILANTVEYDAIQLLSQSARRVKPDWTVTDSNLHSVARICRLTAGMPLGIQLAVSWLDMLSLDEIADEIENDADFLESDMRDVPDRQRSIRTVFEHTWRRLEVDEQETFMKLSVFRGGFTRPAARSILAASRPSLRRLVDKALLSQSNEGRYEIHALLRQYAGAKLEETGEMDAVHDAHSQYFLDFLSEREGDIKGRRQILAIDEIEADFENVRVAWNRALLKQDFSRIDGASESLLWYCEIDARFVEGLALLKRALARLPDGPDYEVTRSRLIIRSYRLIEQPRAEDVLANALSIADKHENWADFAMGLFVYGRIHWIREREYHEALQYFERAHDLYEALGNEFESASVVNRLGLCYFAMLDGKEGLRLTQESADIQRQIGDFYGLGISLNNLGAFHFQLDNFEQSVGFLLENIELGQHSKNAANLAFSYGVLGYVYFSAGQFSEANELATRARRIGQDVGYVQSESLGASTLGLLASIADEEYEVGLEISKQGLRLAMMSNVTLEPFAYAGIALGLCGLGRTEAVRKQLQALARRVAVRRTVFHKGLLAAVWSAYCYETDALQRATRYLSFVLNKDYATFGWARKWPLLQRMNEDLRTRLDEETFNTQWEEGNRMPADVAVTQIVSGVG